MSTEADIVERLRKHVTDRGGASIDNGAWQMMLDAAAEITKLRADLACESTLLDDAIASGERWQRSSRGMRDRAMLAVESLRVLTASNFVDANCRGQRGVDRCDALYDAFHAIRALPDTPAVIATERADD